MPLTRSPRTSMLRNVGRVSPMLLLCAAGAAAQTGFVNWESPHVSPLAMSPDGTRLFAVNTADNRLEVFDLTGPTPRAIRSIPVGLDPVSVRARSNTEVWVVNHISDSVSVVDLTTNNVRVTLPAGVQPADVVFAGTRAFVTSVFGEEVRVFDLSNLSAAPTVVPIQGETPRAMAVSPDGTKVYAAIFESGNKTTIIPTQSVSNPAGPYGGLNPPPNSGNVFVPALNPLNPLAPAVSLILQKDAATGQWRDDNGRNWSPFVTWDLHDHDVAVIDAATLGVTYVNGLMNMNMAMGVRPDGTLTVIGTEATNRTRFEPNITGRFVRSMMASVNPSNPTSPTIVDLNPHLASAYASGQGNVPQTMRDDSIADPRAIVWQANGSRGFVAGMGSNSVAAVSPSGARLGRIDVGQGPTGLALDESRGNLYVLNRFDATISVVSLSGLSTVATVGLSFDPTPTAIKSGRPFLYNARLTSGLGVTACGSCHVDGRKDGLAWDLGDPSGAMKTFNQVCIPLPGSVCLDWHPMKGPMTTQTLQGLTGTDPLHWRGDRENLAAFNGAFVSLQGADAQLSGPQMQAFTDFVNTITYPPNRNRNIDNTLRATLGNGRPPQGQQFFAGPPSFPGGRNCQACHTLTDGTNSQVLGNIPGGQNRGQPTKTSQLRNMQEKAGFNKGSQSGNRGFGYSHAGEDDTLFAFLSLPIFGFAPGAQGVQQRNDVIAFMLSLSTDTHAGVGVQATLTGANNNDPTVLALLDQMTTIANSGQVGLVATGRVNGVQHGWTYLGNGTYQSDRLNFKPTTATLRAAAAAGSEITWTLVPSVARTRIGIDRDGNGVLNGDQAFNACPGDANGDGRVDFGDLSALLANFGLTLPFSAPAPTLGDVNADGVVNFSDLSVVLAGFGGTC